MEVLDIADMRLVIGMYVVRNNTHCACDVPTMLSRYYVYGKLPSLPRKPSPHHQQQPEVLYGIFSTIFEFFEMHLYSYTSAV